MTYKDTIMWKEINETPKIFNSILQANLNTMNELVTDIKNSNKHNFVGVARGTSDNAMVYFKYLLEVATRYTLGLSAPSVLTLYRGKIDYSNSIVIGCSSSGKAEDVLEVIKKGNEQGTITIAVTNDKNSPCAKEAKYHLYCNAGEEKSVVATKSFNAELFLFLWLASELARDTEKIDLLKVLSLDLQSIMPQIDELTSIYAKKFKDMKNGFVLSRGYTYAVALETALKVQETCYIQMFGYAGSEFYHGPLAMVNKETPVIFFAAKNDGDEEMQSIVRSDQVKCVEKLLSLGAPVLLVTNDCILSGRYVRCNDALINLNVPEEFSVFIFSLFAQMFSCKLSVLIGNNPDAPRSMERVTITR